MVVVVRLQRCRIEAEEPLGNVSPRQHTNRQGSYVVVQSVRMVLCQLVHVRSIAKQLQSLPGSRSLDFLCRQSARSACCQRQLSYSYTLHPDQSKHIWGELCALEEFDSHVPRYSSEAIRVSVFQELSVDSFLLGIEVQVWMAWRSFVSQTRTQQHSEATKDQPEADDPMLSAMADAEVESRGCDGLTG